MIGEGARVEHRVVDAIIIMYVISLCGYQVLRQEDHRWASFGNFVLAADR